MLSSIKQVKVGRGIPMLCIRSIVHYIDIYSRIVIQLNMYVKIITSSGCKSTILTDFVQGQLRVPFRFGQCLKFPGSTLIYRKLSSPPQALRLRARLDTKWKKIVIYFKCNPTSRSLLNGRVMGRVRVRRPGNELGTQRDWAGG
jgi:hypothetical protein